MQLLILQRPVWLCRMDALALVIAKNATKTSD
jgi:hypothetical protein